MFAFFNQRVYYIKQGVIEIIVKRQHVIFHYEKVSNIKYRTCTCMIKKYRCHLDLWPYSYQSNICIESHQKGIGGVRIHYGYHYKVYKYLNKVVTIKCITIIA